MSKMDKNDKEIGFAVMKKYLDQLECPADLNKVELVSPFPVNEKRNSSNIYIMRHGERADFVFKDWEQYCFDKQGNYHQKDLNLPVTLPERKSQPLSYVLDTPLTSIGKFQAKSMGKNFKSKNIEIDYVYCSPALRCLQTCDAFLKGLGKKEALKIRIEPSLFEWIIWFGSFPQLMTMNELKNAGFNIDTAYKSSTSEEDLKGDDTMEKHYKRNEEFIKKMIETHPAGNFLVVGHATTLDTCTRNITNQQNLTTNELMDLCHYIPYCSLISLTNENGDWKFTTPPCPSMSYSTNKQFDWKIMLDKNLV